MGKALLPSIKVMESGNTKDIIYTALHMLENVGGGGQINGRNVSVFSAEFQNKLVIG